MNSDERIVVQHGETLRVRGDSLRIEVGRPVFRGRLVEICLTWCNQGEAAGLLEVVLVKK